MGKQTNTHPIFTIIQPFLFRLCRLPQFSRFFFIFITIDLWNPLEQLLLCILLYYSFLFFYDRSIDWFPRSIHSIEIRSIWNRPEHRFNFRFHQHVFLSSNDRDIERILDEMAFIACSHSIHRFRRTFLGQYVTHNGWSVKKIFLFRFSFQIFNFQFQSFRIICIIFDIRTIRSMKHFDSWLKIVRMQIFFNVETIFLDIHWNWLQFYVPFAIGMSNGLWTAVNQKINNKRLHWKM